MSDAKITALTENTTPIGTDLLAIVDDPAGTPATQKITLTSLGIIDGWIPASETWTYASASTITVPTGAASRYQIGDKIKWTQTTVKYGVITAVADTLLTIAVNTDYVVANAAISANFYSHQDNPIGFPSVFAFTVSVTGFSSAPTGMLGRYTTRRRSVQIIVNMPNTGTSNTTGFTINSLPFTCIDIGTGNKVTGSCVGGNDNGAYQTNIQCYIASTTSTIDLLANGGAVAWTASGNKNATYTTIEYPF